MYETEAAMRDCIETKERDMGALRLLVNQIDSQTYHLLDLAEASQAKLMGLSNPKMDQTKENDNSIQGILARVSDRLDVIRSAVQAIEATTA